MLTLDWTRVTIPLVYYRDLRERDAWIEEHVGPRNEEWQRRYDIQNGNTHYTFRDPEMATLFIMRWS